MFSKIIQEKKDYKSLNNIKFTIEYNILGEIMKHRKCGGLFSIFAIIVLCTLIFYQTIITLILPFRFNLFILLIEICLLFCILFRIIWPY